MLRYISDKFLTYLTDQIERDKNDLVDFVFFGEAVVSQSVELLSKRVSGKRSLLYRYASKIVRERYDGSRKNAKDFLSGDYDFC